MYVSERLISRCFRAINMNKRGVSLIACTVYTATPRVSAVCKRNEILKCKSEVYCNVNCVVSCQLIRLQGDLNSIMTRWHHDQYDHPSLFLPSHCEWHSLDADCTVKSEAPHPSTLLSTSVFFRVSCMGSLSTFNFPSVCAEAQLVSPLSVFTVDVDTLSCDVWCGLSYLLWCFICLSLCAVSLRRRITGGKCPEWFKYQIYQMGTDGGEGGGVSPTSQHGSWWLHCVRIIVCHCVTLVTHNVVFRRKYPSLLSLPNTTNSPPKIKYTTFAKRSTTLPPTR